MTGFDLAPLVRLLPAIRGPREAHLDQAAAAVWTVLAEPGDGAAGRLVAAYGATEALERARSSSVPDAFAADEFAAARARWLPRLRVDEIERALERAAHVGAHLLVPADDEWPARLDDLGVHAPLALWVRGDAGVLRAARTDWHVAELELAL